MQKAWLFWPGKLRFKAMLPIRDCFPASPLPPNSGDGISPFGARFCSPGAQILKGDPGTQTSELMQISLQD